MQLAERLETRRLDYALVFGAGVLWLLVGLGMPGFWEPWESSVVQLSEFVQERSYNEAWFWVPQNDNHLIYKPLALIWSLIGVHAVFDSPGEFVLRLPGATLGMATLLLTFAWMRRSYSRRAAFASTLVLLTLPIFVFSSRLLTTAIWQLAAVSIPLLLYGLSLRAETRLERWGYGAAFSLSPLFAFLAGGLLGLGVVVATLAIFLVWRRSLSSLAVFARPVVAVGLAVSVVAGWSVFDRYREHVAFAIEDRVDMDADRLTREINARRVEAIGLRDGMLVGRFNEAGVEANGAARVLLSQDGAALGTPLWRAWVMDPLAMERLFDALRREQQRRDEDDEEVPRLVQLVDDAEAASWSPARPEDQRVRVELLPFDAAPTGEGATRAALEFFLYDLYNPAQLDEGDKAVVRSIVQAEPHLGKVYAEPYSPSELAERLAAENDDDKKGADTKKAADDKKGDDTEKAADDKKGKDDTKKGEETKAGKKVAKKEKVEPFQVGEIKNGTTVTMLSDIRADGWVEVQTSGNKRGWARSDALDPQPALGHPTFDNWVRYVGFGLFPWLLLLPFALGHLLRRREDAPEAEARWEAGGLMLIWMAMAALALGIGATALNQKIFLGVIPVAVGSAALMGDDRFWRSVEGAPMLRKLMGFAAMCLLATLLHDYFESPWLFVEPYLSEPTMEWDEKLRVMEKPYRFYRFFVAVVLAGAFFGAVSWGNRLLVGVAAYLRRRFAGLIETLSLLHRPGVSFSRLRFWEKVWRLLELAWSGFFRWIALAIWYAGQFFRRSRPAWIVAVLVFAVMTTFVYLPAMSHHLTQKGLLERYEALRADDSEPLYNLQARTLRGCSKLSDCETGSVCVQGKCRVEATSFYLGKVESIQETELIEKLRGEDRVFSIIPRKELGAINSKYRKSQRNAKVPDVQMENLYVLDARSSRSLLVSNELGPGEVDENEVAPLILNTRPTPEYLPPKPKDYKPGSGPPVVKFQNGLEFLGYDLDPDQVGSGDELTITYYFHVTRDISQDWQMFLHMDYPGNRINGDHYPGDGALRTNTWIAGDYIKDIQKLEIDRGSSAGQYEMWFGFFSSGDNRLKVTSGVQDGGDRVKMGKLTVTGGI